MRQSLGLEICKKMEIKIDETYHVVARSETEASVGTSIDPKQARFFSRKSNPVAK